jgi:dihydroorotate dehydrogenase
VVTGMSGDGVTPISYLTLANAVPQGIEISGNGGPMTYKAAMDFLALGVKTVQFCTIATKFGYGIIRDLESGTAFLMQERGIKSMKRIDRHRSAAPHHRFHGPFPGKETF